MTVNPTGASLNLSPKGVAAMRDPQGASFSAILERALDAQAASAAPADPRKAPMGPDPDPRKAPMGPDPHSDPGLYEQCEALETFLMKTLLTGMRKTVMKTELLDGGFAGEIYEDMLYDEYAKDLTKYGGFGLAELAYRELTGQRGKLLS